MVFHISAAVLFSIAVIVLCKFKKIKTWHACLCVAAGFTLATSPFAPVVDGVLKGLVVVFKAHAEQKISLH